MRSTLSLRGAKRCGNLPEGNPCYKTHARYFIMGPNGILCTRWEKEHASVRQTFVACDDCLVKNEAYDVEKGANKHKSEHCRPRQCDFKSVVCAVGKLRIYHNFGVSRNNTLTKSKYHFSASQNITCEANLIVRPLRQKRSVVADGRALFPFFRHILFLLWRRDFA